MKSKVEILPLLLNLNCQYSINKLVEVSYKIALHYLKNNSSRVNNILLFEGITLKEFAIESISTLFKTDDNNELCVIKNSLTKWSPPVDNENEANKFIICITQTKVNQHIFKVLSDSDPFFTRILRKINNLIRKKSYKKIHYLGRVYIVANDTQIISGKIIPEDTFNLLPNNLFIFNDDYIYKLLSYLKAKTSFSPAIPLNQLVFKTKQAYAKYFTSDEFNQSFIEEWDVDSIINKAVERILIKLDGSYVKKGKLRATDLLIFEKTLFDIAFDLKDGGVNRCLHNYYLSNNDKITINEYDEKYRNILEYLFKLLKKYIIEELKN